jgi:CRISPR type IV-associated protein Csf3
MNSENFENLKIELRMVTPVCLTYPFIHFDAILAHLLGRREMGDDNRARPSKEVNKQTVLVGEEKVMPLKQSSGVYHASVSLFDDSEAQVTTIYKRFCEKYLDMNRVKRSKIHIGMGYFRSYMIRLVYLPVEKVNFFACGDSEEIRILLSGLTGLGKKTSVGFGMIKDFKIHKINQDYSIVKDGKSMRAIPIVLCDYFGEVVNLAWRAPYWAKEMVAPCVPPHTTVKLSKNFYQGNFKTRKFLVENKMMIGLR